MIGEPAIVLTIAPANPFLWAVKSYIDLISTPNNLTYGSGLETLYAFTSGSTTLNYTDIKNITDKSKRLGIIPKDLFGFMSMCVVKNCNLYASHLVTMINNRIIDIYEGKIKNPLPSLKYSPVEGRRYYYIPDTNFIRRVLKIFTDINNVATAEDLAVDAVLILSRLQITEGHIYQNASSFDSLSNAVARLYESIYNESKMSYEEQDYRRIVKPLLVILWSITKMMYGDLTIRPDRSDINLVDLEKDINISDGTLASIPFPTKETLKLFNDSSFCGVSAKGQKYLNAVSAIPGKVF